MYTVGQQVHLPPDSQTCLPPARTDILNRKPEKNRIILFVWPIILSLQALTRSTDKMRNSWKEFFYFSKSDRIALWLIMTVVVAVVTGLTVYIVMSGKNPPVPLTAEEQKVYKEITAAIEQRKQTQLRETPYYYQTPEGQKGELFYFDPNTADSTQLLRLGLRPYVVRNIYKYRAKGGVFRKPDDFARLYGLDKAVFERLRPYIRIGGKVAEEDSLRAAEQRARAKRKDSVNALKQEKYTAGVIVDLNRTDTTELKKIPGIGSGYAAAIIRYRTRLGGYVSVNQLKEINIPEELFSWFHISGTGVERLKINSSTFSQLNRHPYLNFYQTKAICEHRRKYGPIKDIVQLRLYTAFTQNDLHRIAPYLDFSR